MGYVTSLFARKVVAAAGTAVDPDALLRSVDLDPGGPWDPKVMLPDTAYYDLLERIAAQTDVTDLPVRVGASIGDIVAGMFLGHGVLAALLDVQKTGLGRFIDVAMLDSQLALLEHAIAITSVTGEAPQPSGARGP